MKRWFQTVLLLLLLIFCSLNTFKTTMSPAIDFAIDNGRGHCINYVLDAKLIQRNL